MSVCSLVSFSSISAVVLKGRRQLQLSSDICGLWSLGKPSSYSFLLCLRNSKINHAGHSIYTRSSCPTFMNQTIRGGCWGSCSTKQEANFPFFGSTRARRRHLQISLACKSMSTGLLLPKQRMLPMAKCNAGAITWPRGFALAGLIFALLLCNLSSAPAYAEADAKNENKKDDGDESYVKFSHGRKVYTDYSVIGIPGDGRCLFRSVAHGACLSSRKPPPDESIQRELADELRAKVADEFIKRRKETEWFVEGDFDTYVSQIRKSHVWGGEPELLMASHVLQMPIIVYMHDGDAGGLISIAEYGQEYSKRNPIKVLYHGFGHYDALEIPGRRGLKSRL